MGEYNGESMNLTPEQNAIYQRNRKKAWKYFVEQGIIPKDAPPYSFALHHKDETLRHTNIERYILWLIEDLEVDDYGEHSSHHNKERERKPWSEEAKKKQSERLKNNPKTFWYTDGETNYRGDNPPEGFHRGKTVSKDVSKKYWESRKNRHWKLVNGVRQYYE